jgi:hypothetical protein
MQNGFVRQLNADGSIDWRYVKDVTKGARARAAAAAGRPSPSAVGIPSFSEKKAAFYARLHLKHVPWEQGYQTVRCRRSHLLVDAVAEFTRIAALRRPAGYGYGTAAKTVCNSWLNSNFAFCFTGNTRSVWKESFRYQFVGEPGEDAGGVAREFYQLVSDKLFDIKLGLFKFSDIDTITYQINPASKWMACCDPYSHIELFRFVGHFLARALQVSVDTVRE